MTTKTDRRRWDSREMCLCGVGGCLCLPNPRDIELSPGERIVFGRKLSVDGLNSFEDMWIRGKERSIANLHRPTRKTLNGLRKLLDALYRKTIHVSGQDEETRLWAVEKLMDVPNLSL